MTRVHDVSRRALIAAGVAGTASGLLPRAGQASDVVGLSVLDNAPRHLISPLIYGDNEIGVMDGGAPSATIDRTAGVTARRLGGDLMSAYNWTNNATNAGSKYNNSNGAFLLEALQAPRERWSRPAVVIETMHESSLAMGAKSLVTLPIGRWVAADLTGPVAQSETAPSRRFVETRWTGAASADDPVDPNVCDMPQLLRRLAARYGAADSARGIYGYALDNEPGLWAQNHPRLTPASTRVAALIARSIEIARTIKSIDPAAKIFGPVSWGATGMASLQSAPDWPEYARYGSFLAAYLDAFRQASERYGVRLLDMLDVHWYPFSSRGNLFRTDDPDLDAARLDAPRSLNDREFVEDSWVSRALRKDGRTGLGLPILPSLSGLAARWFPGTQIAITEFNYGGGARMPSALALVDALGRYGAEAVAFATHWGSLAGFLAEAYRVYRSPDDAGEAFGGSSIEVKLKQGQGVAAFAADDSARVRVVVVNKRSSPVAVDIGFASGRVPRLMHSFGFDNDHTSAVELRDDSLSIDGGRRFVLPARSARRYAFVR